MKISSTKQAFTLPEVVITVLLLTMIMLPISQLAYGAIRSTRYARDVGNAIAIGQAQFERFGELDYANLQSGSTTVDTYSVVWTVEEANLAKVVRMTISWKILGKTMQANLNTIYTSNVSAGISFE